MKILRTILFLLPILLSPCIVYGGEYATFESLYKDSSAIAWIIAGLFAVSAAALIYFTGGTASPIVTSIGSWIGSSVYGLSGVAATNAGLALLGGGSIASGGFGIIGGVAVLTAALSFGTDIVIDYSVGNLISVYSYSKFAEESKTMTTLPVPQNDKGPKSYKKSIKKMGQINQEEPLYSNYNQNILRQAFTTLNTVSDETMFKKKIKDEYRMKKESLSAVILFLLNDYADAKEYAYRAIQLGRELEKKRTVPAFVYAASSLYDETIQFDEITNNYFRYAVLAEPDNPIIPLLFSIYLDRMMYRFADGGIDEASLWQISLIAMENTLEEHGVGNYPLLLARYFVRLKIEQQKIYSLTATDNLTIKNSEKTLATVKSAETAYGALLRDADTILAHFLFSSEKLDDETKDKAQELYTLLNEYQEDMVRLHNQIKELEDYQISLKKDVVSEGVSVPVPESDKTGWPTLLFMMIVVCVICILLLLMYIVMLRVKQSKEVDSEGGKSD